MMAELVMNTERQKLIEASENQRCSTLAFLACLKGCGEQGEKKLELLIRENGDNGKRNTIGLHSRNNQ